ncbi:hypothetical protein [Saccharothrix variisporea]|uniref:Uncharacterized protein n=1 Tax=Saccharothrix variisporea TaxID=543527 RepID=A0A495XCB6_9PSEU|nr:hypothetical protein [Saccharothrix variisporea]RKT71652.1 hypothetical protein DFJ66_4945 [Saccharothrix variisporea]
MAGGTHRFLRRWGVDEPDDTQAALAARYLRHRRVLYLVMFLLVPGAATRLDLPTPEGAPRYLAAVVLALLLAEAVAALWKPRGPRVASLTPRRWQDLVPRWAVALLSVLAVVTSALVVMGLLMQPWADRLDLRARGFTPEFAHEIARPPGVLLLVGVAVGLAAVLAVVWLALRRGAVGDPATDAALRTRSARVAVGLGMVWMAWLLTRAFGRLSALRAAGHHEAPGWLVVVAGADLAGLAGLLVAVLGWIWVTNVSGRVPYVRSVG